MVLQKIIYRDNTYNTLLVIDGKEYKYYKTDRSIIKRIFCLFPIIVNKKFIWMKFANIRFRLYFTRSTDFDDGLTYSFFWSKLKHRWEMEDIINIGKDEK